HPDDLLDGPGGCGDHHRPRDQHERAHETTPATGHGLASYSTWKCASVVCPVRPLMGRMSWGQAENATRQSISARRRAEAPRVHTASAQLSAPADVQGMFMKRLSGEGVAGIATPSSLSAACR